MVSLAQQTVLSYSTIIKDLRREIQTQKIRHQSSENALQAKLTHQVCMYVLDCLVLMCVIMMTTLP